MLRAVSKYCLLSISPPRSQWERHNAVELQPITGRRIGPLHRRSSVPYICLRRFILRFTIDRLRALRVVGTWLLARPPLGSSCKAIDDPVKAVAGCGNTLVWS